jgi:hypothetical protein
MNPTGVMRRPFYTQPQPKQEYDDSSSARNPVSGVVSAYQTQTLFSRIVTWDYFTVSNEALLCAFVCTYLLNVSHTNLNTILVLELGLVAKISILRIQASQTSDHNFRVLRTHPSP